MKNLHKINSLNFSDEMKLGIIGWNKEAYLPAGERRLKFKNERIYYFSNLTDGWTEIDFPVKQWTYYTEIIGLTVADFRDDMVIIE